MIVALAQLLSLSAPPALAATVIEDDFERGVSREYNIIIDPAPLPGAVMNVGPQRLLGILVDYADDRRQPIAPAALQAQYDTVIAPYLEMVSYGRATAPTPDVIGVLHSTRSTTDCNFPEMVHDAIALADPMIDFRNYDFVSLVAPKTCGWGGIAFLGRVTVTTGDGTVVLGLNANDADYGPVVVGGILIHELGHNLGIHHAGTLSCAPNTLNPGKVGCNVCEYCSRFSAMGNAAFSPDEISGYFEPMQRLVIGWLEPGEYLIDPLPGRYVLTAHSLNRPGVLQTIGLSRGAASRDRLWVSARAGVGFDARVLVRYPASSFERGALLHVQDDQFGGAFASSKPLLLDAEAPRSDAINVVLLPGMTFTDPATGCSVTTVSDVNERTTVDIGPCTGPPSTTTTTSTTGTGPTTTTLSTTTTTRPSPTSTTTTRPPTTSTTTTRPPSTATTTRPPTTVTTTSRPTTTTLRRLPGGKCPPGWARKGWCTPGPNDPPHGRHQWLETWFAGRTFRGRPLFDWVRPWLR